MIRTTYPLVLVALTLALAAPGVAQTPVKVPLQEGVEVPLEEIEDLQTKRLENLKTIKGTVAAQAALVDAMKKAHEETGESIYLWHAFYYHARVLNDRVRLAGEAIASLEELYHVLDGLPMHATGVLIERKLAEMHDELARLHRRYHGQEGQERDLTRQAFVELYTIVEDVRDLRQDLEDGDAAIRKRRQQIRKEIRWLESRLERDRFAREIIAARVPVLAVQDDIDQVRAALGAVQDAIGPLTRALPRVLGPTEDVSDRALAALENTKLESNK